MEIGAESKAQLAMADVPLDGAYVESIAAKVANEVVAHFNVTEKDAAA